ncbi:MAG: hypothetical protein ACXU9U_04475 [Parachlamydiaceae bacterium]
MEVERRALYNLMRMNWLRDPSMAVAPWQVEDYRELPLSQLWERLHAHGLQLDKSYFLGLADAVDTPEDLTAFLLEDMEPESDPIVYDQIYLLIFELWRRFITDRPCLSIFCDELDHQIHLYDTVKENQDESIQDVISTLQTILDENTDKGADPHDVFKLVASNCAHDLESFLYDYICDQLDNHNEAYANELLDAFKGYVTDLRWYEFLRTRLLMLAPKADAKRYLSQLIDYYGYDEDLEFNLEVLAFMVKTGNRELFSKLVKKTLPLVTLEGDFQDLLDICADFYHYLDLEPQEQAIKQILNKRVKLDTESKMMPKDPAFSELLAAL